MHFHLPKPLHGWREFLGEVGIIVLGVLIALGAEQMVEVTHQRIAAREVRANILDEVQFNISFVRARTAQEPCIARRINELQAILADAGNASPTTLPRWVGHPDSIPALSERWKTAIASGRSNLLTLREQDKLDDLYHNFDALRQNGATEQQAWLKLRLLERWSGPLPVEARLFFGEALEQAKHQDFEVRRSSFWVGRAADDLGVHPFRQRLINSICIAIDTPPNVALAKLSRNRSRGNEVEMD